MAGNRVAESVGTKILREIGAVKVKLALLRDGRFNQHHAAHGVATELSGKRAIQNFYLGNLTRGHHGPARCTVKARLQQVVQGHTIRKHHGARGLEHVGTTHAHGAIGVANKTPANHQTGFKLHHIFCGGDVDADQILLRQNAAGMRRCGTLAVGGAPHGDFFDGGRVLGMRSNCGGQGCQRSDMAGQQFLNGHKGRSRFRAWL